jgi:hypothetical protein
MPSPSASFGPCPFWLKSPVVFYYTFEQLTVKSYRPGAYGLMPILSTYKTGMFVEGFET